MKTKNVKEGGHYWANVSGERVEVEVVRVERDVSFGGRRRTTKFLVRRVDNGQLLPKRRTAAALHPSGEARWPGMTERQEDSAVEAQETGPYSDPSAAHEKAMVLKRQGAGSIRVDKRGNKWWVSFAKRQEDLDALDVTYHVYGLNPGHTPITFDTADEFIEAMEDRGFEHTGYSRTGGRLRPELQGQPKFRELAGPMYDGGRVRYETWALNEQLSD